MVFNENVLFIILFILSIWLAGVSFFTFRMIRHYNTLIADNGKTGLAQILEHIVSLQKVTESEVKELQKALSQVKKDGELPVQRVGLVRFNPFSDTGGSQSFTLSLLDGRNNGLVMTSLYARTGNRWYIKEVIGGKGKELALSKEEQESIQKARPFGGSHA